MAKGPVCEPQSDSHPFKSMYKEGYITVANHIAELIFQRRAQFSKSALPQSFWNLPKYKTLYGVQLKNINNLLERVDATCILKAFNETNCCTILNPKLVELAEKYQSVLENTQKIVTKTGDVAASRPSTPMGKVNRLSEL